MDNIVIATIKEWNIENYFRLKSSFDTKYNFYLISNKEELTFDNLKSINPKYVFFPHWSWILEEDIYINFNCIVFHMTDLPYGRGGSPLQNLIVNEVYDTKISALRADGGLDTGDIYLKEDFNIMLGSAEENFIKLSNIVFEKMIPRLIQETISPIKQSGDITTFRRRTFEDSDISKLENFNISKLYDFIRMLDAEGYPKAFIKLDNLHIELSEVHLKNKKLVGRFEVFENE